MEPPKKFQEAREHGTAVETTSQEENVSQELELIKIKLELAKAEKEAQIAKIQSEEKEPLDRIVQEQREKQDSARKAPECPLTFVVLMDTRLLQ
uniref:Uncharacterized protein n=1 Tax=Sphaerodactylus townsendi TaxID=933632 RepID=A0ACB8E786_9SAUR